MSSAGGLPSHHGELYEYWREICGTRSVPTRADIDPIDIVRLLPFVGLIEHRSEGYFWRLMGTGIVEHFGRDLTGEQYGPHFSPPDFVAATIATFDAALEQETPFFDEFVYRSATGSAHAVSRLVCPLAADRSHPAMVIHTRIHRYCSDALRLSALVDQVWGELLGRWPIYSLDEVDRRADDWLRRVSSAAALDSA